MLAKEPWAFEIGVEHTIPLVDRRFVIGFIELGARIVDKYVDVSPAYADLCRGLLDCRLKTHVELDSEMILT